MACSFPSRVAPVPVPLDVVVVLRVVRVVLVPCVAPHWLEPCLPLGWRVMIGVVDGV